MKRSKAKENDQFIAMSQLYDNAKSTPFIIVREGRARLLLAHLHINNSRHSNYIFAFLINNFITF